MASVVVIATLLVAGVALTVVRTPPRLPLPNPNGYDDFLKATRFLTGDLGNASTLDHDGLQALVSTNAEPLRLTRLGLSRGCSVPTDSAITNIPGMLADLSNLKSLAHLLVEEGRLAEMEGRYADAAQSYIDAIHFGNEMSRGGPIIVRLVGIACEAIGHTPLSKLVPKLKPEEARRVVVELEKIDNAGVTWAEVRRNEKRFAQHQLRQGFNPLTWVMTRPQAWTARRRGEMRNNRIAAHLRLLSVEVALRNYRAEVGRAPTSLGQLVPQCLHSVPRDPFSGRSLVYRVQGTNWLLYSVGEDRVDDGGKRVGRSSSPAVTRGDIFYDSPH